MIYHGETRELEPVVVPNPISELSGRVNAIENDMRQIDTVLGGEEVIPNVETEVIEEDAGNVQTGED